jgi:hypothetical protein
LVSEPVWSLVSSNMLCDPKAIWRKVLSSFWSSMTSVSVIKKPNPHLSSKPGSCYLGDRTGGARDSDNG